MANTDKTTSAEWTHVLPLSGGRPINSADNLISPKTQAPITAISCRNAVLSCRGSQSGAARFSGQEQQLALGISHSLPTILPLHLRMTNAMHAKTLTSTPTTRSAGMSTVRARPSPKYMLQSQLPSCVIPYTRLPSRKVQS